MCSVEVLSVLNWWVTKHPQDSSFAHHRHPRTNKHFFTSLKTFLALGACCVPIYAASLSTGPTFGKLIDFKRKEEALLLKKEDAYDPAHWKIKLLNKFHGSPSTAIGDNFVEPVVKKETKAPAEASAEEPAKTEAAPLESTEESKPAEETPAPAEEPKSESAPSEIPVEEKAADHPPIQESVEESKTAEKPAETDSQSEKKDEE